MPSAFSSNLKDSNYPEPEHFAAMDRLVNTKLAGIALASREYTGAKLRQFSSDDAHGKLRRYSAIFQAPKLRELLALLG
jgi:hypothetical protein